MSIHGKTGSGLALALLAAAALVPAPASAQSRPSVTVQADGLMGPESLRHGRWSTLLVTVSNPRKEAYRGDVVAEVTHWDKPPVRHRMPLDLPAGTKRRARFTVFLPNTGNTVEVGYEVDGRRLASTAASASYGPSQSMIAVLADPPRLRGALMDIQAAAPQGGGSMGAPTTRAGPPSPSSLSVGVLPTDDSTGDPLLPTHAVGWAVVELLVVSGPMLARISEAEEAALTDWLRAGGRMLVFPRTDADLRDPFLTSLTGELSRCESVGVASPEVQSLPAGIELPCLDGGEDFEAAYYGGSTRIGFGRVHVASWDGANRPYVDDPATRNLVEHIADKFRLPGLDTPLVGFGVGNEQQSAGFMYGGGGFQDVRAELDPNESFRPALALVAVVLLMYVFIVGPVNFTFVGKRNRPTLALATTPAAAAACLGIMLGVGYVGKGTTMRYRAVELVESVEGEPYGPARRYTGLFLTRPATFDLEPPPGAMVRPMRATSADHTSWLDHGGPDPVLRDVHGRLWETLFVREDRMAKLGRGVELERRDGRIVAVHNRTPHPLRGAFVLDTTGNAYDVGDLPADGRTQVSSVAAFSVGAGGYWSANDSRAVADQLGIGEHFKIIDGLSGITNNGLLATSASVLYARWDKPPRPEEGGTFVPEMEVRLLRVVPREAGGGALPPDGGAP